MNCLHALYTSCSMLWTVIWKAQHVCETNLARRFSGTICSSSLFLRDGAACNCDCTCAIHSTRQHLAFYLGLFLILRCCAQCSGISPLKQSLSYKTTLCLELIACCTYPISCTFWTCEGFRFFSCTRCYMTSLLKSDQSWSFTVWRIP